MTAEQKRVGDLNVRIEGKPGAPWLMFSNSLGTDLHLWDEQAAALADRYRILRYDTRGHGGSAATPGPYTIDQLGHDALAVLDALGIAATAFCGLSLGGLTGQWLAINAPGRLSRAVLANTASVFPPPETWRQRIEAVTKGGMAAIVDAVMERWFTAGYRKAEPARVERIRKMILAIDPKGYVGCSGALMQADVRAGLSGIRIPVLTIAGRHDPATTQAATQAISSAIVGANTLVLEAAHLSNVERAEEFTRALAAFLELGDGAERGRYDSGMKVRRAVLGDPWVDRAQARRNPFNAEFQDLITRYAWGEIWTRPGLPRHTRSLLVIAMTLALGKWEEFRLHTRAAFNNGVTKEEIKEVLLQAAVYCGVPAANTAVAEAEKVFAEMEPKA
ncbi:MAG: 3-oxoadipate enol-lactonase [Alphaproteobacteria bacterium]|nr:3-oxoadipate enol-lactonase [Alphaproteobacteria bacterium]